jgi:hypothetical protein
MAILAQLNFSYAEKKVEALRIYYSRKAGKKVTNAEVIRQCLLEKYDTLYDPTYVGYKPDQDVK